jgi:limonene-1,2-epoxide hydrolase
MNQRSDELTEFVKIYSNLNSKSLSSLGQIYHENIVFEDPAHRIEGLDSLTAYFDSLFQNINYCHFDIASADRIENRSYVTWSMRFSHPKLKKGQEVILPGMSYLEFEAGKVRFHRDYFDLGSMIYQHVPILGSVIELIKRRLGQ